MLINVSHAVVLNVYCVIKLLLQVLLLYPPSIWYRILHWSYLLEKYNKLKEYYKRWHLIRLYVNTTFLHSVVK